MGFGISIGTSLSGSQGGAAPVSPPTVTAAVVDHDANILVTLSEAMDMGAALPPANVFTVGGAVNNLLCIDLAYDDATTLHLTLDAGIEALDLPTLTYERGATAPILSDAGGTLADFADLNVTNPP